jgi:hypothetical protein
VGRAASATRAAQEQHELVLAVVQGGIRHGPFSAVARESRVSQSGHTPAGMTRLS